MSEEAPVSEDETDARRFDVASVEKTSPPAGASGGDWYEYVIGRGDSAIKGKREGTLRSVTRHAREFAENLNRRASLGYSPYAARRTQK